MRMRIEWEWRMCSFSCITLIAAGKDVARLSRLDFCLMSYTNLILVRVCVCVWAYVSWRILLLLSPFSDAWVEESGRWRTYSTYAERNLTLLNVKKRTKVKQEMRSQKVWFCTSPIVCHIDESDAVSILQDHLLVSCSIMSVCLWAGRTQNESKVRCVRALPCTRLMYGDNEENLPIIVESQLTFHGISGQAFRFGEEVKLWPRRITQEDILLLMGEKCPFDSCYKNHRWLEANLSFVCEFISSSTLWFLKLISCFSWSLILRPHQFEPIACSMKSPSWG